MTERPRDESFRRGERHGERDQLLRERRQALAINTLLRRVADSRHSMTTADKGLTWFYGLKVGRLRAIVSTEDGFAVRSRCGWNMTPVLPELRAFPPDLVLDWRVVASRGSEPYLPLFAGAAEGLR